MFDITNQLMNSNMILIDEPILIAQVESSAENLRSHLGSYWNEISIVQRISNSIAVHIPYPDSGLEFDLVLFAVSNRKFTVYATIPYYFYSKDVITSTIEQENINVRIGSFRALDHVICLESEFPIQNGYSEDEIWSFVEEIRMEVRRILDRVKDSASLVEMFEKPYPNFEELLMKKQIHPITAVLRSAYLSSLDLREPGEIPGRTIAVKRLRMKMKITQYYLESLGLRYIDFGKYILPPDSDDVVCISDVDGDYDSMREKLETAEDKANLYMHLHNELSRYPGCSKAAHYILELIHLDDVFEELYMYDKGFVKKEKRYYRMPLCV